MSRVSVLLAVAALVVWAGPPAQAVPELKVVRAAQAPAIDGDLADACWQEAPLHGDFVLLGKAEKAAQQTRVRAAYDDSALYLAVECDEAAMGALTAVVKQRDGGVWSDDCVEVFLAPAAEPARYHHFLANPLGTQQDEVGRDPAWNADWRAAAGKDAEGWRVEVAIPYSAFPLSARVGERWRINVARSEKPSGETSSWAPCKQGFHEPDAFGTLALTGVDFVPYVRASLLARAEAVRDEATRLAQGLRGPKSGLLAQRVRNQAGLMANGLSRVCEAIRQSRSVEELAGLEMSLGMPRQRLASLRAAAARAALAVGGAPYALTVESTLTKVRPDVPYTGRPATRLSLSGARDEVVDAQVVVVPVEQALQGVRASLSALRGPGGAVVPASAIRLRRVGYVRIAEPSGGAQGGPGLYPDPLLPLQPFDVDASGLQPLWLTLRVPAKAPAGHYDGTLTIAPGNAPARKLPVSLRVFGFTLPRTSRLRTVFQIMPGFVAQRHKLAQSKDEITGWTKGLWTGADTEGRADYFGKGVFRTERDSQVKHAGSHSVRVTGVGIRRGVESPRAALMAKLALKPDADYTLSLWYRTRDLREGGADTEIAGAVQLRLEPSEDWRRVEREFHTPADLKETWIYLRSYALGDVWFDDVSLKEKATGAEVLPNPGFEEVPGRTVDEMLHAYRLNHLEHRASDMNVAAPRITIEGSRVSIDWADFDRAMAGYLARGLNAFNVYWCRVPSGWGTVQQVDAEQLQVAEALLRQTQAHLEATGWLKHAYLYVIDEPGAQAFPDVKAAFSLVKRAAPRLKTLLTFGYGATRPWKPGLPGPPKYAELADLIDIWVPHIDCFEPRFLDTRRKRGEEIWHYVCISAQRPYPNMWGIDYPGIDHRMVFWQLWRYRITGFLYWATTYWTKDVWQDPLSYPGGNGDGSLLYPGPNGPIDSIRWEIIRDGIRDYDYLALLAEKAGKRRSEPTIRELLDVSGLTPSFTDYTRDPQALERRRLQIGAMLERLSRRGVE